MSDGHRNQVLQPHSQEWQIMLAATLFRTGLNLTVNSQYNLMLILYLHV